MNGQLNIMNIMKLKENKTNLLNIFFYIVLDLKIFSKIESIIFIYKSDMI